MELGETPPRETTPDLFLSPTPPPPPAAGRLQEEGSPSASDLPILEPSQQAIIDDPDETPAHHLGTETPKRPRAPLQLYRLIGTGQMKTLNQALEYLRVGTGRELRIRPAFPGPGKVIIQPLDRQAMDALQKVAMERPQGITIAPTEDERKTKGVLLSYPHELDMTPITQHQDVVWARRCRVKRPGGQKVHTKNVELLL